MLTNIKMKIPNYKYENVIQNCRLFTLILIMKWYTTVLGIRGIYWKYALIKYNNYVPNVPTLSSLLISKYNLLVLFLIVGWYYINRNKFNVKITTCII